MPECICTKNCYYQSRRFRPGNIAFFAEVPTHFEDYGKYQAADRKRKEERSRPDATQLELQAMVKELTSKNRKLARENSDLRKPKDGK